MQALEPVHHALWKQHQIVMSCAIHPIEKFDTTVDKYVPRVHVLRRLVVMIERN